MKSIYLADDDADDREIFKQAVTEVCPDMELTCASDGSALIKKLHTNVPPLPDIIFLDINMPIMNGHDAIATLKKESAFNNIPIVVYSTSGAAKDIDAMYNAGADFFITKPLNYTGIKSLIQKICVMDFGEGYTRPAKENFLLVA